MERRLLEMPAEEGEKGRATADGESHLELRLGISSNSFGDAECGEGGEAGATGGGGPSTVVAPPQRTGGCGSPGTKRGFSETMSCPVDPWRLAARQQTAAAMEQRSSAYHHSLITPRSPTRPLNVGWPPLRAFRKNLATPLRPSIEIDVDKESKKSDTKNMAKPSSNSTMVGRKIDLMTHTNYGSLSRALHSMLHNFLSVDYSSNIELSPDDELNSTSYVILYEDNEGDQMLVGDVPWEMFTRSVRRLYITRSLSDQTAE
ncbi:unnamed protein product [Spirodela intermedia]|uniref:Auxin-responsive protein n=1 Tax=Spirodela intermedia TaxID=51605 RepID=A0A7I8IQT9_SPIIN|nr:unnamed protein product [Spirodela intermedia]CAA6660163.1 unnamed protein product [Spirodela intermedia]